MRRKALAAVLAATALWAVPAPGVAGPPGDTSMVETFQNAPITVTPGLCAPGDTPSCVGPEVAQFKVTSDVCVLNGRFEGVDLPANAPCSFELYGFEIGLVDGQKPACGSLRFYTSDHTTAFGSDKVSTITINGSPRRIHIEGYSIGLTAVFTKVVYDGPDGEPEHYSAAPPALIQRQGSGSGVPCVDTPLSSAVMPAGGAYHM